MVHPHGEIRSKCEADMAKETSKEKWDNEGRNFNSHRECTAEMDGHLDDYKPKVEVGKETSHEYKRR